MSQTHSLMLRFFDHTSIVPWIDLNVLFGFVPIKAISDGCLSENASIGVKFYLLSDFGELSFCGSYGLFLEHLSMCLIEFWFGVEWSGGRFEVEGG